jgi:hypothetical protein
MDNLLNFYNDVHGMFWVDDDNSKKRQYLIAIWIASHGNFTVKLIPFVDIAILNDEYIKNIYDSPFCSNTKWGRFQWEIDSESRQILEKIVNHPLDEIMKIEYD